MKAGSGAWLSGLVLMLTLWVSGCVPATLPPSAETTRSPAPPDQTLQPTETIQVQLTIPVASNTPEAVQNTTAPASPTATLVVLPSATLVCDQAGAGISIDVTVPDNTPLLPGQSFTKIWQLQNTGTCAWTSAYAARFFYGNQMSAPDMVFLGRDVPPGGFIEISVDMVAPMQPGTYQGNWKLRNADGALFGIGPRGDSPFWVRIQVLQPETTTPTISPTPAPSPTLTETPTPSPSPTPTPEVLSSDSVTLNLNQSLDLDFGAVGSLNDDDVLYRKDAGDFHILIPINGAQMGIAGGTEPTPDQCRKANTSAAPLTLESLPNQVYLCYQTSAARIGWLRYDGMQSGGTSVDLSFMTWLQP